MKQWIIAWRTLLRRPGYTVTALLMLTLGIGATCTLFSVVDTILLKPLPYPQADRLVTVFEASPSKTSKTSLIAPVRLEDWNRMQTTFDGIAGVYTENITDTSGAEPERLSGRRVSPRFFDVYGVKPLLGRTFQKEEDIDGGPTVAVITYGFWARRYAQDPNVLGKRLVIGGKGWSIIGVMPKEFTANSVDVWLPAQLGSPLLTRIREARFYSGIGRLKPGVTMQQAQADLARVQLRLGEQFPQSDKNWSALVGDLKEQRVGDYRRTLLLVFGAVGLLLLIAVANIAGLTLAQLNQREREMAIRNSVGASRGQVIGTVMREVLLISAVGAFMGGAVAVAGVSMMSKLFATLPRMSELQFDWQSLAFAVGISLVSALAFGLAPAIQATRSNLARLLGESSRSVAGGRRVMQRGLVVAQLALTVLLLASAGLLLRSYYNLSHVDAGFDTSNVMTFHVGAAWNEDRVRIGQMQVEILNSLRHLPGVENVGVTNFFPASGATLNYQVVMEGMSGTDESATYTVGSRSVSDGYLKSLKFPLVAGEWCPTLKPFSGFDKPEPGHVMVNRRFVEQFSKGQNLIGRHIRFAQNPPSIPADDIVGVVGDVKEDGLGASATPYVYSCIGAGAWPDPEYVVRTQGDPRGVMNGVREIVHQAAPKRAIFGMKTLDTLAYWVLSQKIPFLLDQPLIAGPIFGAAVHVFMQYVVIPMSKIGARPFNARVFYSGLVVHMIVVGPVIALVTAGMTKRR